MSDKRQLTVELTSEDGFTLPAYVALPAGKPRGAIVVLQEIFGVNSHIRNVADGYAAAGYLAVAPATFHRVKAGVELGYTGDDMGAGMALKAAVEALASPGGSAITPLVMQDIAAAVKYASGAANMATQDTLASAGQGSKVGMNVGIVGYCWGGLLTWRAACMLAGVSAAVPYYGGGMTVGDEPARQPKCPVLCHFGDQDKHITLPTVLAFKAAQKAVDVQIYAADHGFNCDQRGSYNAAAATLALERTLAFFHQHVG
jgi:carboxymethylenebutenolidase